MNTRVNEFFSGIKGKRVAFCGMGQSNLPAIYLFHKKGAKVIACDCLERDEISDTATELEKIGIELRLGKNYLSNLNDIDIIFRTPGIKFSQPELVAARENGVVVTSEMEVFFDLCPCKIIAVTGSDGKTTTTSIIYEILKSTGKTVHLGGNIGTPLLPIIEKIGPKDFAVVELSSFQLISMKKGPDVAVVTNIEPNHLDIHKDMAEYINAKKNIFLHQTAFSRTVLNYDNDITRNFSPLCRGNALFFSRQKECDTGAFEQGGTIFMCNDGNKISVMPSNVIKIPGTHNLENYLAAICAVWGLVPVENIVSTAKSFGGVEHRSEFVAEKDGVKYYNDSIASSPTRTISGTLSLFENKIILIAGGYDKKIPFDRMGPVIVNKVKLLILMGQTADKIEDSVKKATSYQPGHPEIVRVNNMDEAVKTAQKRAIPGDIVSLSPACASFGLYKNFAERGNHFKSLVKSL